VFTFSISSTFNNPSGVAVDSFGNVYVADLGNNRIQKFDSSGTFLGEWGGYGSGDGQFSYPQGVAVDSSGNVYVADTNNHRIQKFTYSGILNSETLTQNLINKVKTMNLKRGVSTNLDAKLKNAKNSLTSANASQRQDAINKLQAFINACEAQRDKGLTPEQADELIESANTIIAILQQQ
jgi:DNA-binding beta-propeller fold protein YncE